MEKKNPADSIGRIPSATYLLFVFFGEVLVSSVKFDGWRTIAPSLNYKTEYL